MENLSCPNNNVQYSQALGKKQKTKIKAMNNVFTAKNRKTRLRLLGETRKAQLLLDGEK